MMFGRVVRVFRSLRFTIFLIICLASVFLIGVIVPQKNLLGKKIYLTWKAEKPGLVNFLETLNLTEVYTSPVTLTLWVLFFLNLITVMAGRIPGIWRRYSRKDIPQSIDSVKRDRHYKIIDGRGIDDINVVVGKMGYRFFPSGNFFWAVKNRFSPLATILFHLSFFLLLLGGVITLYTKFRAEIDLAVGETFKGQYKSMVPPKIGGIPETVFRVENIKPTYFKKDLPVDVKIVLNTRYGRKTIGVNRPYREGPLSFVIKGIDVAPLFVVEDRNGNEIDGAYVKIRGLAGQEDFFAMAGYNFRTVFHTDILADLDSPYSEKSNLPQMLKQSPAAPKRVQHKEIVNPAVNIAAYKKNVLLRARTIRPGEHIEFDGYRLVFKDLTYWVKFYVVKEHGLGIVYTGFALITLALVIRFVFYRRDLKGFVEQGKIHMSGRAEFFPSLFDNEFERITERLERD